MGLASLFIMKAKGVADIFLQDGCDSVCYPTWQVLALSAKALRAKTCHVGQTDISPPSGTYLPLPVNLIIKAVPRLFMEPPSRKSTSLNC
jgi:hypothetical protein